jgi:hypothetical protein
VIDGLRVIETALPTMIFDDVCQVLDDPDGAERDALAATGD